MAIDSVVMKICFASEKHRANGRLVKSRIVHGAAHFLYFVFVDSQHQIVIAVAADVFIKRHLLLRFVVGTAISPEATNLA